MFGYKNNFSLDFNKDTFKAIKEEEKKTNHDIKAIEYVIRRLVKENTEFDYYKYHNYIHFSLTSQDINSLTNTLSLKYSVEQIMIPSLSQLLSILEFMKSNWINVNMISRTHGQPAVIKRKRITRILPKISN